MRSTLFLEAVGSDWSSDAADQPLSPDSPIQLVLDDEELQQREFVEEIYHDLGVGD